MLEAVSFRSRPWRNLALGLVPVFMVLSTGSLTASAETGDTASNEKSTTSSDTARDEAVAKAAEAIAEAVVDVIKGPEPFLRGVQMEEDSPVVSEPGQATFDCRNIHDAEVCTVTAEWTLKNTATADVKAHGFIGTYHAKTVELSAKSEGWVPSDAAREVLCQLTGKQNGTAAKNCVDDLKGGAALDSKLKVHSFQVSLAPGATDTVKAKITLATPSHNWLLLSAPAALSRHHDLNTYRGPSAHRFAVYAGDAPIQIKIQSDTSTDQTYIRHGEETRLTLEAKGVKVEPSMTFELQNDPIFAGGGPVFGLGMVRPLSGEGESAFRSRIGYQLYAPNWVQYEVSVDTDFQEHVVIAPTIEFASPTYSLVVPSIGLGVGLPVSISPETDIGIRIQTSLMFWSYGLVAAADIFSGEGPIKDRTQVTVMAQFSF